MNFDYLAAYQEEKQHSTNMRWTTIGRHLPLMVEIYQDGDYWFVILLGRGKNGIGHSSFDPSFDPRFTGQDWLQLPRIPGEVEAIKISNNKQLDDILNCCTRVLRMAEFW